MAAFTGYTSVTAGQGEHRAIVIEIYVIPARGIMTGRTVPAKLTVVSILLLMAGIAIGWRAHKYIVTMAGLTRSLGMFAL